MRRLLAVLVLLAGCSGHGVGGATLCERTGQCVALGDGGVPVSTTPALALTPAFVPPVPHPLQISSTFGPRWKTSASRYDFHPGIDYYDVLGTPVYAIGPGTVRGTYPVGSTQFPNGGNVVVVEHALPGGTAFQGGAVTRFFAVYLHLDSYSVAVDDVVTAGQTIGAMGMTGDTQFVHLHFETRVQTVCSLPYQLANPSSTCVTGFDPHVHPYLFVGGDDANTTRLEEVAATGEYVVRYVATRGDLDLDVVSTDLGTLGFDERLGIDATSLTRLDDFDYGWVRLVPLPFESASTERAIELHFPRRPAFLELRDVWGHGTRW